MQNLYIKTLNLLWFCQINQKGSEKPLELAFDKMVTRLGNGMIK